MEAQEKLKKGIRRVYRFVIVLCAILVITAICAIYFFKDSKGYYGDQDGSNTIIAVEKDPDKIENGIHVRTGLVEAEGLSTVVQNCTNCHSAQLVMQHRMPRERWEATIRWMQETQNLWDLGANEAIIIDYLVTNYPPIEKGRRAPLSDVEWYVLKD